MKQISYVTNTNTVNLQNAFCGHYVLNERLGETRDFVFYGARHSDDHHKHYQAKVLKPKAAEDKRLVEHLHLEHQLLRDCDHPGIPRAYRLATVKDLHCLITEAMEGPTLGDLYDEGAGFDHLAAYLAVVKLIAGLHDSGFMHNNICPESFVLRMADGVLFLADWSKISSLQKGGFFTTLLARKRREFDSRGIDPDFLAPELAKKDGQPTKRSDVYALGQMGYFLLGDREGEGGEDADRRSSSRDSRQHSVTGRSSRRLRAMQRSYGQLPKDLVAIIENCLRNLPSARPTDAGALLEELKPFYQHR